MRIAHIGLASFFTVGMTYQDNQLVHQNALDGNTVLYISNAQKYKDGKIIETGFEDYQLPDGVRLIRLPYQKVFSQFLSGKIRKVIGLYKILEEFSPDVILSHDLCYAAVKDVVLYKQSHPEVKVYADTHTAAYNSGTNWLSLNILHRIYYKYLTKKVIPYLEKYFYVGESEKRFSIENYGVPESIMEYLPLGGVLLSDEEYEEIRKKRRCELGINDDEKLYLHTGKLGPLKRTKDLLEAFSAVEDDKAKLVIIGLIADEQKPILLPIIEADKRVTYLGWKSGDELQEYLCACDLYCQPGSVSATMQNAVCRRCAIMAYPHLPYTTDLDWGNIFWVKTKGDIVNLFESLKDNPKVIDEYKANSQKCAEELLDYKKLARRYLK